MEKNKNRRGLIIVLIAVVLLLGGSLVGVSVSYYQYRTMTAQVNVTEQELKQEDIIALETFKQYAQEYNVGIQFLQRFFKDEIVYKSKGRIVYEPIDKNLAGNNLDWNNLVSSGSELEYRVNGTPQTHKIIDVSTHQGEIDWAKVKADGVDHAYIRLGFRGWGSGKIMLDEQYKRNMEETKKAGVKVGVYFFSQAVTKEEAVEEAEFVKQNLVGFQVDLPVVFDVEQVPDSTGRANILTSEQRTDVTVAFCETVKKAGYEPMIYANAEGFFADLDFSRLEGYQKWFAQYFDRPFFPYELRMWQYTANGKVDGIKGGVDVNLCFEPCK